VEDTTRSRGRSPEEILVNYNFGGIILEELEKVEKRENITVSTVDELVNMLLGFAKLGVDPLTSGPLAPKNSHKHNSTQNKWSPKLNMPLNR
jgi:hypothetical protein